MADLALRDKGAVPAREINVKGELSQYRRITDRDMYTVQGRRTPSARLVREWATLNDLHCEIAEAGKDKEKAWCRVRGWQGDKDAPKKVREAYVCHVFSHLLAKAVIDAISNGITVPSGESYPSGAPRMKKAYIAEGDYEVGVDGWPVIKNPVIQFQVMKNHLNKIEFSERDALTKAERAVFLKLLDSTWHEDEVSSQEPEEQPSPRKDQKLDLEGMRGEIWNSLLLLCNGNTSAAYQKLAVLSEVTDPATKKTLFPSVSRVSDVAHKEHAEEIMARVLEALRQEGKGEDLLSE